MSRSYLAIFPVNPLKPKPPKAVIVKKLKEKGFLSKEDYDWKNPETQAVETYFRPGANFQEYFLFENANALQDDALAQELIDFKEHEKVEAEFNSFGEFRLFNPVTGTDISEDWGEELGSFLEDHSHQWTDPANGQSYYFFELECPNVGLGTYFITIEEGLGEPTQKLLDLLEEITGQKHQWMRTMM